MPKVSVITVVKNDALGLSRTHKSLIIQTLNDWEMIIVMAPSLDSTFKVANEFHARDSRVKVFEETNAGIYHAMNEGIAHAVGDFIWFMNAGDIFANKAVLAHAVDKISAVGVGVLIGGYKVLKGEGSKTYIYPEGKIAATTFAFNRRGGCHQAMLFDANVIKNVGGFNTTYLLASDFHLVLKIIKDSGAQRVSELYAKIEPGGRSDQEIFVVHKEKHKIRQDLLGGLSIFIASLLWTHLAKAKIITRKLFNEDTRFLRKPKTQKK